MTTDEAVPVFLGKVALDLVSFWRSDVVHVPTAAYLYYNTVTMQRRWIPDVALLVIILYKRSMTSRLL